MSGQVKVRIGPRMILFYYLREVLQVRLSHLHLLQWRIPLSQRQAICGVKAHSWILALIKSISHWCLWVDIWARRKAAISRPIPFKVYLLFDCILLILNILLHKNRFWILFIWFIEPMGHDYKKHLQNLSATHHVSLVCQRAPFIIVENMLQNQ